MFGWLSWGLVMHCQWVWRLVAGWGALWDWLKVFRVGGAACGCSVGIGNPWQTLPLLLSSLMESEESLEVASVSSTPPQSRHAASAQHYCAFLTLHPPGHSQPLMVTFHLLRLCTEDLATCKWTCKHSILRPPNRKLAYLLTPEYIKVGSTL